MQYPGSRFSSATIGGRRTAFDWRAYANRSSGLRLLRASKAHVDTLILTQDGFSDTVHWQVIVALCPELINDSQLTQSINVASGKLTWRVLMLPMGVNGLMARKLVQCAYGERVFLDDPKYLREFYQLSRSYNIDFAIGICLDHARKLLNVQNCIQLLLLSLRHNHQALRRASYKTIRSSFKLILNVNEDFHLIPSRYLQRLLLDDFLRLNEAEEFAWLAIVRWVKGNRLTYLDLIEIYNHMISLPPIHPEWIQEPQTRVAKEYFRYASARDIGNPQLTEQAVNFIDALPFDWTVSRGVYTASRAKSMNPLELDNVVPLSDVQRREKLYNLLKCLRFMRFRSLNAFNTILASEIVRDDDRLELLVNHMRLVYMVKKKIPLDRAQMELIMPGQLERIKLDEMGRPKRALRFAVGLVKNRGRSGRSRNLGQLVASLADEDNSIRDQVERPSKLEPDENEQAAQNRLADVEKLARKCLEWADKPRVPNSVALLIGGWQDGAVSKSMMAYDFVCDKWFKLNVRLPEPRAFHASCSSPRTSEIFIFGGTNGDTILNSVLRFDPANDILKDNVRHNSINKKDSKTGSFRFSYRFHKLCPMSEGRCHLSGVFHSDGRLYALGGHDGRQRLRSGEFYDPILNQWHSIAEMTIARSDASACSHDNKIFIAGGQISDQFIQSSVEFYKPNDNTWTFATPMIVPRMSFKLVSYKNHLLAIGGANGLMGGDEIGSVTRSVERYNPSLSSWSLCTAMGEKRSSFDAMNIENNLIVVGGHGSRGRLKSCESLKIGFFSANTNQPPVRQPIHLQSGGTLPGTPLTRGKNTAINTYNSASNGRQPTPLANNRLFGGLRGLPASVVPLRSTMKWVQRANLPSKRSGFSISVVGPLQNAREMTYHGSRKLFKGPSVIKRRNRWHRLKVIKRRKLIKNLKIAIVVTIVISIL